MNTIYCVRCFQPQPPELHWRSSNKNIELPYVVVVMLAVVIMDFAIYLQQSWFMSYRCYGSCTGDITQTWMTTGARFHSLEIVLSMPIKFATIILLGPAVIAIVIFEVLLNAIFIFKGILT